MLDVRLVWWSGCGCRHRLRSQDILCNQPQSVRGMADETKKSVQLLGKLLGPMLSAMTKPFVYDIQERFQSGMGELNIGSEV